MKCRFNEKAMLDIEHDVEDAVTQQHVKCHPGGITTSARAKTGGLRLTRELFIFTWAKARMISKVIDGRLKYCGAHNLGNMFSRYICDLRCGCKTLKTHVTVSLIGYKGFS